MQDCDVPEVPEGSIPSHIGALCWVSFVSSAQLLNMIGLAPCSALCSLNLSWHGCCVLGAAAGRCGPEPAHRRIVGGPCCVGQDRPWHPRLDDKGAATG